MMTWQERIMLYFMDRSCFQFSAPHYGIMRSKDDMMNMINANVTVKEDHRFNWTCLSESEKQFFIESSMHELYVKKMIVECRSLEGSLIGWAMSHAGYLLAKCYERIYTRYVDLMGMEICECAACNEMRQLEKDLIIDDTSERITLEEDYRERIKDKLLSLV